MYIHIGGAYAVSVRDIIGIMDLENTSTSYITRDFLRKKEKSGEIITVSPELPKSFVITDTHVYITPITAVTLQKRYEAYIGRKEK